MAVVKAVLAERGIAASFPTDSARYPGSDSALDELRQAKWVLAVLPEHSPHPTDANLYFELGFAFALSKPVLTIAKGVLHLPAWVAHRVVIQAEPADREAIAFAVDQMLAAPVSKDRRTAAPIHSQPIGAKADRLLARLNRIAATSQPARERMKAAEQLVFEALNASGLAAVEMATSAKQRVDFAVWADELGSTNANPVVIEVRWSADSIRDELLHKLDRLVSEHRAGTALLLVVTGDVRGVVLRYRTTVDPFTTRVRVMSVADFLRTLRHVSLPHFLLRPGDYTKPDPS
jgi:hypothetical protein